MCTDFVGGTYLSLSTIFSALLTDSGSQELGWHSFQQCRVTQRGKHICNRVLHGWGTSNFVKSRVILGPLGKVLEMRC